MKITITLIVALCSTLLFGQNPSNDPHWNLVWGDEFNSLNTSIWKVQNHFDHYGGEPQVYTDRPENVFIDNGNLVLKVQDETYSCPSSAVNQWGCARQNNLGIPYEYTSGWVETKATYNTEYGYIESRVKLPYGQGFWPAFWTFVGGGVTGVNAAEIDIFEMLGNHPSSDLTTNLHHEYCNSSRPDYSSGNCTQLPSFYEISEPTGFSWDQQWHTYGIEWSPSKIIWYVDGFPIRFFNQTGQTDPATGTPIYPVDPVRIILNLALAPWSPPNGSTPFPSEMRIDYVKVYELDNSQCNTIDLNACSYNFSTHDNKVKRNITIGTGGCSNSLLPSDNVYMRASKGILINGDFTVPVGAQLYLDVNGCY